MTLLQFLAALARLTGIVVPAVVAAHIVRRRFLTVAGALGVLAEAVLASSVLLVVAEGLGLAKELRPATLIPTLVLLALVLWRVIGADRAGGASDGPTQPTASPPAESRPSAATPAAAVAVAVVAAQWCVQSANALGAGMFNFDTLWYHMPFAVHMAQTGAVTGVQFTQADPFVAYYPANSELFHALGIVALHNDFLSPLLNLLWLAVALLASWCLGRPWRVERQTLIVGCLVSALPVLSGTQPGEAFNDITGLAMLLAGTAIALNASGERAMLALAGLALGVAVGTKFTFIVPAFALIAGIALSARRGSRRWALAELAVALGLTAGWWYLRNLIAMGNPLGQRLHIGPVTLAGPLSPLESASQQTVISELGHLSLWGSRFAPGLSHALGPLWPLVLALYLAAVVAGIVMSAGSLVRVLAATAAVTGISYLFLPTGATAIEQGTTEFQVNLRYVTPALALGIMLVPIVLRLRRPRLLVPLGYALLALLAATQLERALWPTQPARHLVFLLPAGAVVAGVLHWRRFPRQPRSTLAIATAGLLIALVAGGFAAQRHYFNRRYLVGDTTDAGLGSLYRWAQRVAHSRIALYGTVQQYPLYGARDTNRVDYLGTHTADGGFAPITSCVRWRSAVNAGAYRYLVLTPAPTPTVPVSWTQGDPSARLVLSPGPTEYVFELTGKLKASGCPPA